MKKRLLHLLWIGLLAVALVTSGCANIFGGEEEADTYTVTYDGNGSTGGSVPTDTAAYEEGATVTVLGNTGSLVKDGYEFTGWNTADDGSGTDYAADATFAMGTANVTLYAQWDVLTYSVTYDGNGADGGTVPSDSAAYEEGDTVTVLGNTGSLENGTATFEGWNTAADGSGTAYVADDTFTMGSADVTLYADWGAASGVGTLKADDTQITALTTDQQTTLTNMYVAAYEDALANGVDLGSPANDEVHWWDAAFTQNLSGGDNTLGDPWSLGLSAILAAKGPDAYAAYAITNEVLTVYNIGPAVTGAPLANEGYGIQSFENGYFTIDSSASSATFVSAQETVAWTSTTVDERTFDDYSGEYTAKEQDQILSQIKRGIHVAKAAGYNVGTVADFKDWVFGTPERRLFNANCTGGDTPDGATYNAWGLSGILVGSLEADAGYLIANEIFFEWHRVGNGGGSPGGAITPPIYGGTLGWDSDAGHATITGGEVDYTATKDGVMQVFQGGVIEIDATNGDASTGALWKDNDTLEAELAG